MFDEEMKLTEETNFVPYREREMRTYFIRSGETIKIGSSREPQERLSGLQTAVADELELLIDVPFSILTEDQAHSRFAHLRIRGEWFSADPELVKFIEDLRFTGVVPPEDGEAIEPQIGLSIADEAHRADLLAARNGALALRKQRPELKYICGDVVELIDSIQRCSGDIFARRALAERYAEINRRIGNCQ